MGRGIIVCGLNGVGKSTLGRALAGRLGWRFLDIEDLYFPKNDLEDPYAAPRSREEVEELLCHEVEAPGDFVLAAVKGNYGEAVCLHFQLALWLQAPRELRLERVRARSFQKFGARMLPGGDLYEREEAFFRMAAARQESVVEEWLTTLPCPVLPLDATRPVEENVERVVKGL